MQMSTYEQLNALVEPIDLTWLQEDPGEFFSLIQRDPHQKLGPGVWTLYKDGQPVACWPCITGGPQLSEYRYAGLTPRLPSGMMMKYEIGIHEGLYSGQDHTAWVPVKKGEEESYHPNQRTWWNVNVDEFRTHKVGCSKQGVITGKSTGCPSIPDHEWERGKGLLNLAYQHSQQFEYPFVTFVRNYGEVFPINHTPTVH